MKKKETQLQAQLEKKLISTFDFQGRFASYAEWATFAYLTLNTDVRVGRSLANHLVEIVDTLTPAMPEANNNDLIQALSSLAKFINVALVKGVEGNEEEMTVAWETLISKISYPNGNNQMGIDVDAGIQRIKSTIAIKKVQEELFGQVVNDYNDLG